MHAVLLEHSELIRHSGRQFGGLPRYPDVHEQAGLPLALLHIEFGPQGEGTQGSLGISGIGSASKMY